MIVSAPIDLSSILYVTSNHPIETMDNFDVLDVKDVTITDCGADCLSYYGKTIYSETQLKVVTGHTRALSSKDLGLMLNAMGYNSCIVEPTGVIFKRCNDSEFFACIIHESSIKDEKYNNHWLICKVVRKAVHGVSQYASSMHTPAEHDNFSKLLMKKNYDDCSNKQKLFVAYSLLKSTNPELKKYIEFVTFDGKNILNGSEHAPPKGMINIEVPHIYRDMARQAFDAIANREKCEELNQIWDMMDEDCMKVKYNVDHAVRDIFYSITNIMNDPIQYCRQYRLPVIVQMNNQTSHVDVSELKMKTGDLVFLRKGAILTPVIVNITSNSKMMVNMKHSTALASIDLYKPKSSIMSMLMRLTSLFKVEIDENDLARLYKDAIVVSGYGGTGKSTSLIKWRQENLTISCAFCANTSGGVTSLQLKLPVADTPTSFEKLSYNKKRVKVVVIMKPLCYDLGNWP